MRKRPLCMLCLALILGLLLMEQLGVPLLGGNPLPTEIRSWVGEQQNVRVCGVTDLVTETEQGIQFYLKQSYLLYQAKKYPLQNILIKTKEMSVPPGAFVLLSGSLEEFPEAENPGAFDRRQYYAVRHCYYEMADARVEQLQPDAGGVRGYLGALRQRESRLLAELAGEQAPLLQAVVLGDKSELSDSAQEQLRLAGYLHICSISGMHIGILGMGLYNLLKKLGASHGAAGIPAMLLVLAYGLMTGSSVSALRAVLMFLTAVMAKLLGRIYDPLSAMALSAILLLLESPGYLKDGGFLLSFTAVLSIGAIAPGLQTLLGVQKAWSRRLVSSLALFLGTLPVMLVTYGEVSLAGLLLNLLLLPFLSVVLGSGLAALILGELWKKLGWLTAWPGRMILAAAQWLSRWPGRVSGSVWTPGAPSVLRIVGYVLGLWILLAVGTWLCRQSRKRRAGESEGARRRRTKRETWYWRGSTISALVLLTVLLTLRGSRPFSITCLSVGQGDGIVLQTPEGEHFLIDGGSTTKAKVGRYEILPYLRHEGISVLDAVFVSHTDQDHVSGVLELLELIAAGETTLRIRTLVLPGWETRNEAWQQLSEAAKKAGVPVQEALRGQEIRRGELAFQVLQPETALAGRKTGEDPNEDSQVLQVTYGNFKALFPGDAGEEAEKRMLEEGLLEDVDFLKVGHHGSRYSTGSEFLECVKPEAAVISCARRNRYGHPAAETLERLQQAGVHTELTMIHGAVTVSVYERQGEKEIRIRRFRE